MAASKRLRRAAKRAGRAVARITARGAPVIGAVLGATGAVIAGPAGGAVGTAVAGGLERYAGAAAARSRGYTGTAARKRGRRAAKRAAIGGIAGTGAGTLTAGLIGGSSASALGGLMHIFGGGAPSGAGLTTLPDQPGGLVTLEQLASGASTPGGGLPGGVGKTLGDILAGLGGRPEIAIPQSPISPAPGAGGGELAPAEVGAAGERKGPLGVSPVGWILIGGAVLLAVRARR